MFKCSFLYFKFKVNYLNALIHLKAKTVQGGTSFSWIRRRNSIQAVTGIQLFRSGCGVCAVGGYGDVSAGGVWDGWYGDVGPGGIGGGVGVEEGGVGVWGKSGICI